MNRRRTVPSPSAGSGSGFRQRARTPANRLNFHLFFVLKREESMSGRDKCQGMTFSHAVRPINKEHFRSAEGGSGAAGGATRRSTAVSLRSLRGKTLTYLLFLVLYGMTSQPVALPLCGLNPALKFL